MEEQMDIKTIIQKKSEVITKYGPWTAHNIQLRDDIYTIAPEIIGDEVKLRRIVQCVLDLVGGSVEGLRILDLACLEGLYAIEFARHKATCLGIEGREANVEKARFAKQVLLLDNLSSLRTMCATSRLRSMVSSTLCSAWEFCITSMLQMCSLSWRESAKSAAKYAL